MYIIKGLVVKYGQNTYKIQVWPNGLKEQYVLPWTNY